MFHLKYKGLLMERRTPRFRDHWLCRWLPWSFCGGEASFLYGVKAVDQISKCCFLPWTLGLAYFRMEKIKNQWDIMRITGGTVKSWRRESDSGDWWWLWHDTLCDYGKVFFGVWLPICHMSGLAKLIISVFPFLMFFGYVSKKTQRRSTCDTY